MTFRRLLSLLLLLALLPGCAPMEPIHGCTLAAANRREVLRARAYLHPAIPARILNVWRPGVSIGHSALVYRLDPEGWFAYDDSFGTRQLEIPATVGIPDPLAAGRAAFPLWTIARATWYEPAR